MSNSNPGVFLKHEYEQLHHEIGAVKIVLFFSLPVTPFQWQI